MFFMMLHDFHVHDVFMFFMGFLALQGGALPLPPASGLSSVPHRWATCAGFLAPAVPAPAALAPVAPAWRGAGALPLLS